MNENIKDGAAARVTARRRLIRGAFGAPAALTLYSGNVAASSNLRALNNQLADPKFPAPDLPELPEFPETWIRVRVWTPGGANFPDTPRYVSGSAVLGLPYGCGYSSDFTSEMFTNIKDNTQRKEKELEQEDLIAISNWAAVRFDAAGVIVGVSTGLPAEGTALTMSAGTSACLTPTSTRVFGSDGYWK